MLKEIDIKELSLNPFRLFKTDWALIAAGDERECNAMTAAWGGMGVLWNKNVLTVYIRPQRYTREFADKFDEFTVSFFPDEYKDALKLCGSCSGRDTDKLKAAGLKPVFDKGSVLFNEARLSFKCRKIYRDALRSENFLDGSIEGHYPDKDYHYVYIGEIEKVYAAE